MNRSQIAAAAMFAMVALALLPREAPAQVTGGTIQGTATDPAGAVIPNVTIVIRNLANGVEREVGTNSQGFYSAPNLPAGPYQIKAAATGFSTEVSNETTVTVGAQVSANFAMRVGSASDRVDVTDSVAGW